MAIDGDKLWHLALGHVKISYRPMGYFGKNIYIDPFDHVKLSVCLLTDPV